MKSIPLIFLILFLTTACTTPKPVGSYPDKQNPPENPVNGTPSDQPIQPLPVNGQFQSGNVYIDSSDLLILESYPLQLNLVITGNLPDPCHQLQFTVNPPDNMNNIYVKVYSLTDGNSACIQVLDSFSATIPLGTYPSGHYHVYLNSISVGEFDS